MRTLKHAVPYILGATTFAAGVIVGASLINVNNTNK
jgi:hypothetical protein